MKRHLLPAAFGLLLAAGALVPAAETFKVFPGARKDERDSRAASRAGLTSEVYTTAESYERVYAFYKALYHETTFAPPAPTLPSGKTVRWAYFILDGVSNLAHSRHWLKIQYPYIRTVDEGGNFQDVREQTAIQEVSGDPDLRRKAR